VASRLSSRCDRQSSWLCGCCRETAIKSPCQSQSIEDEGRHRCGNYWHGIMHRQEPDSAIQNNWFRRVGSASNLSGVSSSGRMSSSSRTVRRRLGSGEGNSACRVVGIRPRLSIGVSLWPAWRLGVGEPRARIQFVRCTCCYEPPSRTRSPPVDDNVDSQRLRIESLPTAPPLLFLRADRVDIQTTDRSRRGC